MPPSSQSSPETICSDFFHHRFSLYFSHKIALFSSCFKISSLSLAFSSLIMLSFCFCYFVIAHKSPRFCSVFFNLIFSVFRIVSYWVILKFTDDFPSHFYFDDKPIWGILILAIFSALEFPFSSISLLRFHRFLYIISFLKKKKTSLRINIITALKSEIIPTSESSHGWRQVNSFSFETDSPYAE